LPRNSKGHIIGNSKAAKKAREAYPAELQRCADAADRVRAQRSQEERARSAEVAQFGEEETLRRRREEREARNIADELPTSDIEAMELEDQIADPTLKISACLRVDKRLEWSTSVGTQEFAAHTQFPSLSAFILIMAKSLTSLIDGQPVSPV